MPTLALNSESSSVSSALGKQTTGSPGHSEASLVATDWRKLKVKRERRVN